MNCSTHISVARAVLLAGLPPLLHPFAEEAAKNADLPDRVSDITVGRFGTKIAGNALCSLSHFTVPTTGGHFRGYCWRSDRSLWHCIRRFDPRVGDVGCRTDPWVPVVGADAAKMHPLAVLIRDLGGKATLDADEFTFPTGAVMAEWVWKSVPWTFTHGSPSPSIVGSICHWIQDGAIPHHSRGWLAKGHASFENRVAEEWEKADHGALIFEAGKFIDPEHGPATPRAIVEKCAQMSGGLLDRKNPEHQCLVLGVAWTRAFLRRCVLPSL